MDISVRTCASADVTALQVSVAGYVKSLSVKLCLEIPSPFPASVQPLPNKSGDTKGIIVRPGNEWDSGRSSRTFILWGGL
jgi:hypothetical protein